MARASLKAINNMIAREYPGYEIELVKGPGYFYFIGADGYDAASIYCYALNHMDLGHWESAVRVSLDEHLNGDQP